MKHFVKIFVLTLAAGVYALPVLRAETPDPTDMPPPEHPGKEHRHLKDRGERMAKELGLTAEQQTQMKSLMEAQKTAADAVRADTTLTPDQKHEKVAKIREDFKARRQALLTPEQQKKAEEMKARHKEHRHPRDDKDGDEK